LRFAQDNGFQTSSLIVHDLNNDQFRMYFNCANVSHFSWIDDESIIIWKGLDGAIGRFKKKNKVPKVLSKVLMPIYKKMMKEGNLIRKVIANECYEILNVKENLNRKIDFNNSWTDGHPVAMPNTNEILTDTYQKDKYRKLYIFDYLKETIEHERYILSDDKTDNSNLRCDLHPRVSRSGKYISVDKIFNQKRVIEIYKI